LYQFPRRKSCFPDRESSSIYTKFAPCQFRCSGIPCSLTIYSIYIPTRLAFHRLICITIKQVFRDSHSEMTLEPSRSLRNEKSPNFGENRGRFVRCASCCDARPPTAWVCAFGQSISIFPNCWYRLHRLRRPPSPICWCVVVSVKAAKGV
jgi:hypothetical protein